MNISYHWLKELIDLDENAEKTAADLTRVGLAVEGLHPHGDDLVLDIDLTSNRPDCLSHLGVARELGVILDKDLKLSDLDPDVPVPAALAASLVQVQDPDLCHRFTARIVRNVKVGPSPQWLVDRLEAVGERSINNVADVTNYVMIELGQPMHSFDLDRLSENRIVVRRAKHGEKIKTLDDVDRDLDGEMLAICDAEKPVAIGGVIGGLDSAITDLTVNVLLEVAYFNRSSIRRTSRKLGVSTEASYRFERGVDIQNLKRASDRAADLICQLAGGEKGEFVDVYPEPAAPTRIGCADISAAVRRLTGLTVPTDECLRILFKLGISSEPATDGGVSRVYAAPSWRHDIAIEEDLVEEVARHFSYENIADELPPAYGAGEYQQTEHRERGLRRVLADRGFDEAVTYSFIDVRHDEAFQLAPGVLDDKVENKYVTLQDAVIEGAVRMRPTILPGLLDAVRLNLNHQRRDVKLFELGKVFAGAAGEIPVPNEQEVFSLAITGSEVYENKALPVRELDFYDAKGAVESALAAVGVRSAEFAAAEVKHLRSGQAASISVHGREIGYVGRLSDEISADYKFRQPVYVAEIDLQTVLERPPDAIAYRPLSRYPAITRDVSLLVKRSLPFAVITRSIEEQHHELCRGVSFVDVYEGQGLAHDERSITIRLEYRSDERTLIDDEAESVHQQIIGDLERKLGVKQRF